MTLDRQIELEQYGIEKYTAEVEKYEALQANVAGDDLESDYALDIKLAKDMLEAYTNCVHWYTELKAFKKAYETIQHLTIAGESGQGIKTCIDIISNALKEAGINELID